MADADVARQIETFFNNPQRELVETYRDYIEDTKGFRPSFQQAVEGLVHLGARQMPSLYFTRREPKPKD